MRGEIHFVDIENRTDDEDQRGTFKGSVNDKCKVVSKDR